jgi:hypothetical protein
MFTLKSQCSNNFVKASWKMAETLNTFKSEQIKINESIMEET